MVIIMFVMIKISVEGYDKPWKRQMAVEAGRKLNVHKNMMKTIEDRNNEDIKRRNEELMDKQ